MRDWLKILHAAPLGMMSLLAVAIVLYGALLANSGAPPAGGEEAYSQAWAGFLLTLGLWSVLALMLAVGAAKGRMPVWAALAALLLHPISGLAAFVALDAASRRVGLGAVLLVLLPLPIASYAFWARLPQWREAYPPGLASAVAWGAVALLSLAAFATGL
ncbi:MAG TPA: hypothetical protein VKU03_00185 [Roseiarcus sp.]|nr:hypothetical protein [Roseiarcus sp.]